MKEDGVGGGGGGKGCMGFRNRGGDLRLETDMTRWTSVKSCACRHYQVCFQGFVSEKSFS
jgi:hypothetical protein